MKTFLVDVLVKAGLVVEGTGSFTGTVTASIPAMGTSATTFLTHNSGLIQSRTAAQVLSDIGAQPLLTNPVTGTGTSGRVAYWNGTSSVTSSSNLLWDNTNSRLTITAGPTLTAENRLIGGGYNTSYNTTLRSNGSGQGVLQLGNNAENYIIGGNTAAGGFLIFKVNGTNETVTTGIEAGRITSTGNWLLGATTDSGFRLDVNGTVRIQGNLTTNLTAGSIPFIGASGLLSQNNATLFWDSTNNRLGVATSTPAARFHVIAPTTDTYAAVFNTNSAVAGNEVRISIGGFTTAGGGTGGTVAIGAVNSHAANANSEMTFFTNNAGSFGERMRLTSEGRLGIGSTSLTQYNLRVNRNITGAATSFGIHNQGVVQSDVITAAYGYQTLLGTQATTFSLGLLTHYSANQTTFGAGSTVTTQVGFQVENTLVNATNNYGFRGQIASGTGRYNLYMDGSANNYLAGNLLLNTTTDNTLDRLQVSGNIGVLSNSSLYFRGGAAWPLLKRNTTTGGLIVDSEGASISGALFSVRTLNGTDLISVNSTGNLLIGTTTDNGSRLRTVGGVVDFQGTTATDGGQLGTELLSGTGWTSTDWTGDFATGFTHTTGNTTALSNTLAAVVNTFYQITWTVTGRTAGTFTIAFGGYTSGNLSATGNVGPRAATTGNLVITPTTDFNGTIVMSIRAVTEGGASLSLRNSVGTITSQVRAYSSNTNVSTGVGALAYNTTGNNNTSFGYVASNFNTSGRFNSAFGSGALFSNNIGENNIAVGVEAGRYINSGGNLTNVNSSIFIGNDSRASAVGNTNEIVIGHASRGNGSNTVTIGNSSITNNYFNGTVNAGTGVFSATTASTSTTTGALISAGGLGVAGAGFFGAGITATTGIFSSIVRVNGSTSSDALNIAGNVRLDGIANRIFRMGSSTNYNYSFRTSGDDFQLWEAEVGARMVVRYPTGNIGIGTTAPHISAKMDLTSTTQGVLFPRMTQAQRVAIASPAEGLIVTQTDGTSPGLWIFISSTWRAIALI